jgi:DNA-binding MarR family transcriptional regulator
MQPPDRPGPPDLSEIAFRLNSTSIHLVRRARMADAALGVPPGQLSALSVLVFGGERTIAALAEAEQVTSPTITRIVDGLERSGLAKRHRHPADARATIVRATPKGRRLMEKGRRRRVDVLNSLLERLPADDLAAVTRALDALSAALAAERDEAGGG